MSRLYARSSAEAHLYMDHRPCRCGATAFERHAAVILDGEVLCSRYAGPCEGCGKLREFVFELPEALGPVTAQLTYGGGERSRLFDPGDWLAIADARGAGAASSARDRAIVRAAIEEVMKFLPAEADRVPDDAFFSDRGRAVRDADPERFRRDRLEAMLAAARADASAPPRAGGGADVSASPRAGRPAAATAAGSAAAAAAAAAAGSAAAADAAPADPRTVPALIDALAGAVVGREGFTGPDARRQADDLAGQLHTLIRMYQIQAREELTRRESTAEIEQLLDRLAHTGTPVGAAIAAHRAEIVDAFRQVGIAEIGRGVQLLMQWMRDPTAEHRAPVEQLLAELRASLGAGELAEADASQRRVEQAMRGTLGLLGQPRSPVRAQPSGPPGTAATQRPEPGRRARAGARRDRRR